MKKHLNRYLGMGLAVLLVLVALFIPQGWFALRDAASVDRVRGEALSPLMVAQLDRSYERDIHERMSTYLMAVNAQDVICSSKEIDSGNESLWENIEQAKNTLLMEVLRADQYVLMAEELGSQFSIESCTQYVLMRQSDGQILLVANDIRLDKGNGCYMELLLDGVDGTVYYLESEEDHSAHLFWEWRDNRAWLWWQILNENYYTTDSQIFEDEDLIMTSEGVTYGTMSRYNVDGDIIAYYPYGGGYMTGLEDAEIEMLMKEKAAQMENRMVQGYGDIYPDVWVSTAPDKDIYCCRLTYSEHSASWTMEMEEPEEEAFGYRIRMGLPCVVHAIPDMANRVSLAEYDQIYEQEK